MVISVPIDILSSISCRVPVTHHSLASNGSNDVLGETSLPENVLLSNGPAVAPQDRV